MQISISEKSALTSYAIPLLIAPCLVMIGLHADFDASGLVLYMLGALLLLSAATVLNRLLINLCYQHYKYHQKLEIASQTWRQLIDCPVILTAQHSWEGFKPFIVNQKQFEADGIVSLYLTPQDRKALPVFRPGQYLTIQVCHQNTGQLLTRCYSLSDSYHGDYYRISVKHEQNGQVSGYLHQQIHEGDILLVKVPQGSFYLDMNSLHPVVLIAGGIGITPLLCMLNALLAADDKREIHLFYGVRNGSQVIMKDYLQSLAETRSQFFLHLCYSRPNDEDSDFYHQGRVEIGLLQSVLPASNYLFFLCGSKQMMEDLSRGLKTWGVPEQDIHYELFGSGLTPKKIVNEEKISHQVSFQKSKKTLTWFASDGSLLEFAEKNRIALDSACRSGLCGMCMTKINLGEVEYLTEPSISVEDSCCLACISIPNAELIVDL